MTVATAQNGNFTHIWGTIAEVLAELAAKGVIKDQVIGFTQRTSGSDAISVLCYGQFNR